MAWSTVALCGWLRDALLLREGMQLTRDLAEERAANIVMQLGEVLAQTRCACGAQGTVDGNRCGRCYLEGRR